MSDRARLVTKAEVFQLLIQRDGKVVGLSASFSFKDVLGVLEAVALSVVPFWLFSAVFHILPWLRNVFGFWKGCHVLTEAEIISLKLRM